MFKEMIENYQPKTEQETIDQQLILDFIHRNPDCLERTNLCAHITSSAIIVNETMDQVLFAYHNIYDSWSWVGGHNDGNPDLLEVAIEEAMEETGITQVRPYQKDIFTLDVIYVGNHIKKGKYVPDHLHLNATFLLIASVTEQLVSKPDENQGVRWFLIDEVLNYVTEPRMIPIYQKAFIAIESIKIKQKYQAV
jgi:8-oxo-dGTP pyrophosphatase MutT (NUDIX family)